MESSPSVHPASRSPRPPPCDRSSPTPRWRCGLLCFLLRPQQRPSSLPPRAHSLSRSRASVPSSSSAGRRTSPETSPCLLDLPSWPVSIFPFVPGRRDAQEPHDVAMDGCSPSSRSSSQRSHHRISTGPSGPSHPRRHQGVVAAPSPSTRLCSHASPAPSLARVDCTNRLDAVQAPDLTLPAPPVSSLVASPCLRAHVGHLPRRSAPPWPASTRLLPPPRVCPAATPETCRIEQENAHPCPLTPSSRAWATMAPSPSSAFPSPAPAAQLPRKPASLRGPKASRARFSGADGDTVQVTQPSSRRSSMTIVFVVLFRSS